VADSRAEPTFSKEEIITFLSAVDEELTSKTRVILIGGAAAILAFGNNRGSIDIDTYNKIDHLDKAIEMAKKKTGLKIEFSKAAVAFAPEHFEKRLDSYSEGNFKYLDVWVPELHDFAMMKVARLLTRDLEDIVNIHKKRPLDPDKLLNLYKSEMSHYVGSEDLLEGNYLHTIETLFGTKLYKAHFAKVKKRGS
jgi:hypothetical protein